MDPIEYLLSYIKKAKRDAEGDNLEKELPIFHLDDLVGKTISAINKVKNPLSYNSEVESPNPAYFQIIHFSDESYILNMTIGRQDGSTTHSFFVENDTLNYSNHLFEPEWDRFEE